MTNDLLPILIGLVKLSSGTLTITNLIVKDVTISGESIIKVNEKAGDVDIIGSTFENISRSEGNGSVIEGYLGTSNGLITVAESNFTMCKVNTSEGLGGAIFLNILSGGESKYDLSGS
jgi:hypothetical protein